MTEQDYYTTLMVHGRCWILLEKNNALIEFNRMILTYKINEAILATFLELNNPSYKQISQLYNSINMLPGIGCVSRERTRLLPYLLHQNDYFLASLFLRVRKLYHII